MDLYRIVCDFELGNIATEELPSLIVDCLADNTPESLFVLAGLRSEQYNYFEVMRYYNKALDDLRVTKPSKYQAALYSALCISKDLINKNIMPEKYLSSIMESIYRKTWNDFTSEKYVGDYLGLQRIIGTYYEIDDLKNELVHLRKDIDRKEEIEKEYLSCYELAEEYIKENERKLTIAST